MPKSPSFAVLQRACVRFQDCGCKPQCLQEPSGGGRQGMRTRCGWQVEVGTGAHSLTFTSRVPPLRSSAVLLAGRGAMLLFSGFICEISRVLKTCDLCSNTHAYTSVHTWTKVWSCSLWVLPISGLHRAVFLETMQHLLQFLPVSFLSFHGLAPTVPLS